MSPFPVSFCNVINGILSEVVVDAKNNFDSSKITPPSVEPVGLCATVLSETALAIIFLVSRVFP